MAISTYTELQAALVDYLGDDSYTTARAQRDISLAEAELNRELKAVRSSASLTGTQDVATIDITAYSVKEPIALYLSTYDVDEEIPYFAQGNIAYEDDSGRPAGYTLISSNATIRFDKPLDEAHTFRFEYVGKFALTDDAPTNDLLTNHPDVYLSACLAQAHAFNGDLEMAAAHRSVLREFMAQTRHQLAQSQRGLLFTDVAISAMTSGSAGYNIETD